MSAGFLGHGHGGGREPAPPIFLEFFYKLRSRGVRTTSHEWLALADALERGLAGESVAGLYWLARALLVKTEARYDAFDLAFAEYFRGLEVPEAVLEAIEAWLAEGTEGAGASLAELIARAERRGRGAFGRGEGERAEAGRGAGGGGRGAIKLAERRLFRDYRHDRALDVRQLRVALRRLRDIEREGAPDELDLDETIGRTARNGGEIDVVLRRPRHNRVRLLLLMDTGGSMEPYVRVCEALFSAASQERHWRAFRHAYFHNCVYGHVFRDGAFRERIRVPDLLRECDGDWKLVVVGDACMAMSELLARNGSIDFYETAHEPGVEWLRRLARHFRRAVWLNPMTRAAWDHPSVRSIEVLFPMFELTVDGLDAAVKALKAPS